MTELTEISSSKCWGGLQKVYEHTSKVLGCRMKFAIFLPSKAVQPGVKLPVVYHLSGLGSTEQNYITQSGFQKYAEKYQLIVVGPDTSPRGCNVPGEDDEWDLGTGAGFYVDATQEPWNKNYRMYSYVTKEIRMIVERNFEPVDSNRVGISGHSMGGHGALVAFFRNPQIYRAVSAFAPLSNPVNSPFGMKCFTAYIGKDQEKWKEYDATELVRKQPQKSVKILVDQGNKDKYLDVLKPKNFVEACREVGQIIDYTEHDGYDHGFYFVSTVVGKHMKYFSMELRK